MNMIYKDMQEEQRTKRGRLISGREEIKATEAKKIYRFENFGDTAEMLRPSVLYKLTSYCSMEFPSGYNFSKK